MEQTLIVVDDKDKMLGYAPRSECHTGIGKRHRAFVILLFNKEGKILLQHRKHNLFDKLWDLTAASHPLHANGKDESYIEAAQRCLRKEWSIEKIDLMNVGAFNYFKAYNGKCENEHCALIIGEYNDKFIANPEVAYGYKWIDFGHLLSDIKKSPNEFTIWLIEAVKLFENNGSRKQFLKH